MKEELGENFTQICDSTKQTEKEFEDYLMTTKLRKYIKDINGHKHGNVYKWMNGNEPQGGPTQQHHWQYSSFISTKSDLLSETITKPLIDQLNGH